MHYAVPRILHRAGRLERLYTDFYSTKAIERVLLSALPKRLQNSAIIRAVGRRAPDLPNDRVRSYPWLGLEYYLRQRLARDDLEERSRCYIAIGRKFGKLVVRDGFGSAGGVYAFNTAAVEVFQAARQQGLTMVLEQTIAPRAVEEELLAQEHRIFGGWEPPRKIGPAALETINREREEWDLADIIVCGSEFVREGVARSGGPTSKCIVVPYGVDSKFSRINRRLHRGPLRVLTIGEAGLRKGISYAAEAARMLKGEAEFRWVGPVSLLPKARSYAEAYLQLAGAIPRNLIFQHFDWADVFFLPSICEGSATVTYEALMCGLPVITTPNTGSIVTDGLDGFIVPVRDTAAMIDRLRMLHIDRALLCRMQKATRCSIKTASIELYGDRLLEVLTYTIMRARRCE